MPGGQPGTWAVHAHAVEEGLRPVPPHSSRLRASFLRRYDSHREAILRSGERHQAGATTTASGEAPPDDINLYAYFSSTAYSGFGDGPRVRRRGGLPAGSAALLGMLVWGTQAMPLRTAGGGVLGPAGLPDELLDPLLSCAGLLCSVHHAVHQVGGAGAGVWSEKAVGQAPGIRCGGGDAVVHVACIGFFFAWWPQSQTGRRRAAWCSAVEFPQSLGYAHAEPGLAPPSAPMRRPSCAPNPSCSLSHPPRRVIQLGVG